MELEQNGKWGGGAADNKPIISRQKIRTLVFRKHFCQEVRQEDSAFASFYPWKTVNKKLNFDSSLFYCLNYKNFEVVNNTSLNQTNWPKVKTKNKKQVNNT